MPNEFDEYRPPQEPRKRGRKGGRQDGRKGGHKRGIGAGGQDGSKEVRVAEDFEFSDYYGKPVVKAPPWEWPIGAYLFLGGVAGGSALLAAGAQATGNAPLRTATRLTAFGAAGAGSAMLVLDLGRPERLLNMFRVFKLSSPMSVGSWILASFGAASSLPALSELAPKPLPLANAAGIIAGVLGGPLAAYTAVLLGDTSNPVWSDTRGHLPYVFVSSAALASSGVAMVTTPVANAAPARTVAMVGAAADLAATRKMEETMQPETVRHLHRTELMKAAEVLVAVGGVGTVAAAVTKSKAVSVLAGVALAAGSCCTRFGILEAGLASAQDPQAVIGPQSRRAKERRQSQGLEGDVISTS
ncbi:NrfD/PsrC family molybdoenzyme membrane anchor subunit [Corynebacterium lizhenjunii]|uniref:NrfD/PsrC family molybdoenzyme membrane anchor subunit n=1 Tax=Corynebacterium lizhenjunii TaxID=2709394 RepID=UPI0013ED49B7|nr:NrfD/PsrC family molybdoenzyme membrane anchor subunit [Corynebacterium lizhenjunii]